MKEQSHKEEMSAALRGDFQRLRERGVAPALVPQDAPEPEAEAPPPLPEQPVDEEPPPRPEQPVDEVSPPRPEQPVDEEPQDLPADSAPVRRGWLSRLAGR